jgi:DNA-binding response OmpR family regulator
VSTHLVSQPQPLDYAASHPAAGGEERFAERRRILLLEPDAALRAVLVRSLLRLGCIVRAKRHPQQVVDALPDEAIDGAVVALDEVMSWAPQLAAANPRQAPVVVLSYVPPDPYLIEQLPSLCFLQKPFDMRDLLAQLHLPEKAKLVRTE